jgi:HAMP domain-containing protein
MPPTFTTLQQSILKRLTLFSLLMALAILGIVGVNLFAFQRVEVMLTQTIDPKVTQVLENAELGRRVSSIFARTNLVISTFTTQKGLLEQEREPIIAALQRMNKTAGQRSSELQGALHNFAQKVETLFVKCTEINQLLAAAATLDQELNTQLQTLEDMLGEQMLLLAMQADEEESFALDQLTALLPEYRQLLTRVNILLLEATHTHLGVNPLTREQQQHIISVLDDFQASLTAATAAGQEFAEAADQMSAKVDQYKEHVQSLYRVIETFQLQFSDLEQAQQRVAQVMERIDQDMARVSDNIHNQLGGVTQSSRVLILALSIAALAVLAVSGYFTFIMVRPLRELAGVANQLAKGDISGDIQEVRSHDEIGRLAAAFREMVSYIQHVAGVAEKIAEGNLRVDVRPKSERDVLNVSLKKMVRYIQDVASITEKISQNTLHVRVTPKSEHDVLNQSLQRMVTNLQTIQEKNTQQNWLKDGINHLNSALSVATSVEDAAQKAVTFLARYVRAACGGVYVHQADEQTLTLRGAFALTAQDRETETYQLGEGIVGEVALERSPIALKQPNGASRLVQTGTFRGQSLHTYTLPLVYKDELQGVLELASFEEFNDGRQAFLNEACRVVATALSSASQQQRVQELLRQKETDFFIDSETDAS